MRELRTLLDGIALFDAGSLLDATMELFDRPALLALAGDIGVVCVREIVRTHVANVAVLEDYPRHENEAEPSQPRLADAGMRPVQRTRGEADRLRCFDAGVTVAVGGQECDVRIDIEIIFHGAPSVQGTSILSWKRVAWCGLRRSYNK